MKKAEALVFESSAAFDAWRWNGLLLMMLTFPIFWLNHSNPITIDAVLQQSEVSIPYLQSFLSSKEIFMLETPEQYSERILSYLQGTTPLTILASTPRKLAKLVKRATRDKLSKRLALDKWSVTEILAHLVDTELAYSVRLRLMLEAPGVPIQSYDQNVWEAYSQYKKEDPRASLETFRLIRERNVRLLRGIPAALWEHYGMHSERGRETVARLTELTAGHDINHIRQVERILRPVSKKERHVV